MPKMSKDEVVKAVMDAFPGAELRGVELLTMGHRKLSERKLTVPQWSIRVTFAPKKPEQDDILSKRQPYYAPCFGMTLVPENATPADFERAVNELKGMEYAGLESAKRQRVEDATFERMKKVSAGKTDGSFLETWKAAG